MYKAVAENLPRKSMNGPNPKAKILKRNKEVTSLAELDEEAQTDVIAALDLLMETLGEEKQRLNQEGAKAMQEADYDTAREVIDFATLLMNFHDEVENLTDKWKSLEQLRDSSSPKAKEIVSRRIFSSVTKTRDRITSGSSTGSQRTVAKQVVAQRTTKCVQRCYHLIDYLVANGGYALAQDASKHVNRILSMKYPELKEAKAMMLEKGWISKTLSNRELQVTAVGRSWHLRKMKSETSIPNPNPSTSKKMQSAATSIGKGAKMNDEEIGPATSDELPDKSATIKRALIYKESETQPENLNPDKEAIPDIPDSLTFAPVVFAIRSERLSIDRKEGCSNPLPKGKTNVPDFFRIKDGVVVKTGDWIDDKNYGYGKILQVNAGPYFTDRSDQHKVWFWDGTREVVMANYQLRRPTVRVVAASKIPKEIFQLAPASM